VPGPDLRGPAGDDGEPGPAPAIKIGTVTSGATPSATITGTSPDLTLGLVLPKGDRGDTGAPGALASAASYVIVGPGRPDTPSTTGGTIAGAEPVGAEYRSTDGAGVGAFRWVKRPGNAWAVVDGDTGWRDITSLSPHITAGNLRVRRVGDTIHAAFNDTQAASSADITFNLPAGFRISAAFFGALYGYTSAWGYNFRIDNQGGSFKITGATSARIRDSRMWVVTEAWPTVLPGSPA